MQTEHGKEKRDDVVTLMAQGRSNKEIFALYPEVPEPTIKRWRRVYFAPAAAAAVTGKPKAKKEDPIPTADQVTLQPDDSAAPPKDKPAAPIHNVPMLTEVDVRDDRPAPTDFSELIGHTLRAQLESVATMSKYVSTPAFIGNPLLVAGAGELAALMKVMGDQAIRILEAAGRHAASTHETP